MVFAFCFTAFDGLLLLALRVRRLGHYNPLLLSLRMAISPKAVWLVAYFKSRCLSGQSYLEVEGSYVNVVGKGCIHSHPDNHFMRQGRDVFPI